ncbi:Sodium symporter small subunit putative domain-containing protein [Bordetella tumbae]
MNNMPDSPSSTPSAMRRYWRRNLILIGVLVLCWLALTFLPAYFARELSFDFIGWPFAFWMAAYGAPLSYLVLIGIYARLMNRADAQARSDAERGD